MKGLKIAIDGPAASGKSTTARLVAQNLGYVYIDTGAMYRAATLAALNACAVLTDEDAVFRIVNDSVIILKVEMGVQHTYLDGQDVSDKIRSPHIDKVISKIASYSKVRKLLVDKQKEMAKDGAVVMDGRDIGTVVLPDADLKIFLVASVNARAKRRMDELIKKGKTAVLADVEEELRRRDLEDSSRQDSPLVKANDALELDTSDLTIDEQVSKILDWIKPLMKE